MFERRLKIFLAILVMVTIVLIFRAGQLQVVQHQEWTKLATLSLTQSVPVETSRGRILDVRGREVARDEPCVDACVDYRAVLADPDPAWMNDIARKRLTDR